MTTNLDALEQGHLNTDLRRIHVRDASDALSTLVVTNVLDDRKEHVEVALVLGVLAHVRQPQDGGNLLPARLGKRLQQRALVERLTAAGDGQASEKPAEGCYWDETCA